MNIPSNLTLPRCALLAAALLLTPSAAKSADATSPSNPPNPAGPGQPGTVDILTPPGNAATQRQQEDQRQARANYEAGNTSAMSGNVYGNNTAMSSNTTVLAAREECLKDLRDASTFYSTLQQRSETSVPSRVLSNAKAVVFIDRWAASAVVGGTGGRAIVFKRGADGKFVGPVFYDVAGGSLGAQIGVSHIKTLAVLMTDKALTTLEDSKFVWSGNLRAVAGHSSASSSTVDNNADVYLYQTAAGLDVGATVATTRLTPDAERNQRFYNQTAAVTPGEIYAGRVTVSAPEASELIATLSRAPSSTASAR